MAIITLARLKRRPTGQHFDGPLGLVLAECIDVTVRVMVLLTGKA